ncbi:hypothetical protein DUI87_15299 [Hirundo rustica rustica]|uniref:Uncharacterized protein n=1 Tax=Hirundo rustica rustica TaxID=333673 RepID=A0A3M0K9U2_HIRRU|nr:hypothetical protein DUI87_15299 [Hirundo rustica rustica]
MWVSIQLDPLQEDTLVLMGIEELLGHSDEEDPSCEAFTDQPQEQGEGCNVPAPSPADRPPVQSCSHRPTSRRQAEDTEPGEDGHAASLIKKTFSSSQEGTWRQRLSPNRALWAGVTELPKEGRGNLTEVENSMGSPSANFQPALDLTTGR